MSAYRCVIQVWDVVEQFDTGCSPGGGKDAMHVFYDAGLMFQSSNPKLGTPYRQREITFYIFISVVLAGCKSDRKCGDVVLMRNTRLAIRDDLSEVSYKGGFSL